MPPRHDAHAGAHRGSRVPSPRRLGQAGVRTLGAFPPALALVVASAFVGGGVTAVTAHQLSGEHTRAVARAAAATDAANRARADGAASARLSAAATAYLAARRTAARELATGAVAHAGTVLSASQGVLDPTETAELDEAVARLSTLLVEVPDAHAAIAEAVSTAVAVQEARPAEPAPSPEPALPVEPLADVVALLEAGAASADPAATPVSATVLAAPVTPAPVPAADAAAAASPGSPPVAPSTGRTTPDAPLAASVATTEPAPGATTVAGTVAVATTVAGTAGTARPADVLAAADLGLGASEDLAAAAQRVLDLSAALQTTVDQRVAEAQAAAAAAEAERERLAHETSTQRIRRLVAGAKAAAPGQIPDELLCDVPFDHAVRLRCDAAAALTLMDQAYRAETGKHLVVSSSYRSTDLQTQLFLEKGPIAAQPGTSNHERGQAIDLAGAGSLGQFDAPLYLWLSANAARFGWHHPLTMEPGGSGPLEPWHWEYDTQD